MTKMTDLASIVSAIENDMAGRDDRSVEEYRERYPTDVAPIDALRNVLRVLHDAHLNQAGGFSGITTCAAVEGAMYEALRGHE